MFACVLQPVSVISPIVQGARHTSKPLKPTHPHNATVHSTPFGDFHGNKIQRNQSFHGFQNMQNMFIMNQGNQPFSPSFSNLSVQNLQQFYAQNSGTHPIFIPSIFYKLPSDFNQYSGSNSIAAIKTFPQANPEAVNLAPNPFYNFNQFWHNNPFSVQSNERVIGRNEPKDIRRSRSGINEAKESEDLKIQPLSMQELKSKRFSSLELRKHKCYSPTFYSMRCKKHAKKRPVLYAIPKRKKSQTKQKIVIQNSQESEPSYEDLTDSIQILEQNSVNNETESHNYPKPAPRCKKQKPNVVYANISESLSKENLNNSNSSSNASSENCNGEISVTEALIHHPTLNESSTNSSKSTDTKSIILTINETDKNNSFQIEKETSSSDISGVLKLTAGIGNTPMLKVSPNFVKPKTESPKGALYMQLQAKIKIPSPKTEKKTEDPAKSKENFPPVPQMPLLEPQTKRITSKANFSNQVCFLLYFIFYVEY